MRHVVFTLVAPPLAVSPIAGVLAAGVAYSASDASKDLAGVTAALR
jgi:hypothetical protein